MTTEMLKPNSLVVSCLFLFLQFLDFTHSLSPDGLSLLSLKSAVDGAGGPVLSNWNENDPNPCHWTGVSCMNISGFPDPRVVAVALSGRSLRGYIPSELGTLIFLRRLNLRGNNFYGSIPDGLFNASSLHSLFLAGNNLSGPIPPTLCKLPRLQNVDLSVNSFSGPIPTELRLCKQVQRLILAGNNFSGEIPVGIWPAMPNLLQLDLSSNDFSGSVPEDIGELKSLSGTLNLSFNHFSGGIPKSMGDLPMAVGFDLRNNNFSGEIPQTGSFSIQGPTAFLNNPLLCGFPLRKQPCENSSEASPGTPNTSPEIDNSGRRKGLKPGFIILISVANAVGVSLVGFVILYLCWKKKDSKTQSTSPIQKTKLGGNGKTNLCCISRFSSNGSDLDSEKGSGLGSSGGGGSGVSGVGELVALDKWFNFELDELLRASAYVLGKSGLGIVYKVVLGNGVPVAVRRLGEGGDQRYKEFVAEVQAIGKVKHPNIVKLRAYYWSPVEKLLVSDFISNGSLAYALRGKTGQPSSNLSWCTRLKIAKGTAAGLAYLHESNPRKFVHGDIKPANILLDNEFNPFISDFGLNRLINITGNNPSSDGIIGGALPYLKPLQPEKKTNYLAPEARVPENKPTQKWDVYSYGVVLLELLTGKPAEVSALSATTTAEGQDLVRWVKNGFKEESLLSDMVDPSLREEVNAEKEILAMFHLALACTEADPEARPKMKNVSENLEEIGKSF